MKNCEKMGKRICRAELSQKENKKEYEELEKKKHNIRVVIEPGVGQFGSGFFHFFRLLRLS